MMRNRGKNNGGGGAEKASATRRKKESAGARARTLRDIEEIDGVGPEAQALPDAMQERFAQALLVERNATAAAVKAGYSPGSARSRASKLLHNPRVRKRVSYLLSACADKRIMRKSEALEIATRRARASFVDIADLLNMEANAFSEAIKTHPAAPAIRSVRYFQTQNADGTIGPRMVQSIELFNPRDSQRFIAEVLGWSAPQESNVTFQAGALVLPAETEEQPNQ